MHIFALPTVKEHDVVLQLLLTDKWPAAIRTVEQLQLGSPRIVVLPFVLLHHPDPNKSQRALVADERKFVRVLVAMAIQTALVVELAETFRTGEKASLVFGRYVTIVVSLIHEASVADLASVRFPQLVKGCHVSIESPFIGNLG